MGKTKTKTGEKRKAEESTSLFGGKKDEGLSGLFSAAVSDIKRPSRHVTGEPCYVAWMAS